ncbi:serine/threonine-protein kinase [Paractinoplanes toevensis]|uniref:serine/threonine-protein kinase n=1 Tax=Paractinoplanes toevensis TaxID=571911 RepID=UPI001BB4412D|nr:serine/threonine-protein kinase [Actinoplanes toevensis]
MTRPLWPADPRRLGDYELLGRLGEGGMGAVYLGRAPGGGLVAVKVIRPEYAWDTEFRGRFRSEVNRAREVPGFCTAAVLDADPDHATPYLVVEYVDGPSLREVIKEQGPLSGGTLHSVAVGVATALAAIHGAGVIHRDLKPENVLFSLGTPKVIDFGIARALEVTSRHTRTDQMVGTVSYMAPERFESDQDAGPPADVFAWGVVVAYAATGRTPFRADSPAATAARILTQPPNLTGLDGPLRELVGRALAKKPEDRPTANELLDLLLATDSRQALAERPELRRAAEAAAHTGRLRPDPVRTDAVPRRRRTARILAVAGAAVVLAGAGLFATEPGRGLLAGPRAQPTFEETSAAPPAGKTQPRVQGASVIDPLSRPGQWKQTRPTEDSAGWCLFGGGRLLATTHESNVYTCAGPTDTFAGDQRIAVDVTVATPNACAVIWFRVVDRSGYRASFCTKQVRIGMDNDGEVTGEQATPSTAFRLGQTHRVAIAVINEAAEVSVDGAAVLTAELTDPLLVGGRVQLGALNDENSGDAGAAFANAELRSPTVSPQPVQFADLNGKGEVSSVVKLYSYDPVAHAAVVEPVLYLSGPDYCTLLKIEPTDARCEQETTIVESHLKVTLPVVKQPALTTWDDPGSEGDCIGTMTSGGICPIKLAAFAKWLKAEPQGLAAVTTDAGVATRLAEMYMP